MSTVPKNSVSLLAGVAVGFVAYLVNRDAPAGVAVSVKPQWEQRLSKVADLPWHTLHPALRLVNSRNLARGAKFVRALKAQEAEVIAPDEAPEPAPAPRIKPVPKPQPGERKPPAAPKPAKVPGAPRPTPEPAPAPRIKPVPKPQPGEAKPPAAPKPAKVPGAPRPTPKPGSAVPPLPSEEERFELPEGAFTLPEGAFEQVSKVAKRVSGANPKLASLIERGSEVGSQMASKYKDDEEFRKRVNDSAAKAGELFREARKNRENKGK